MHKQSIGGLRPLGTAAAAICLGMAASTVVFGLATTLLSLIGLFLLWLLWVWPVFMDLIDE